LPAITVDKFPSSSSFNIFATEDVSLFYDLYHSIVGEKVSLLLICFFSIRTRLFQVSLIMFERAVISLTRQHSCWRTKRWTCSKISSHILSKRGNNSRWITLA